MIEAILHVVLDNIILRLADILLDTFTGGFLRVASAVQRKAEPNSGKTPKRPLKLEMQANVLLLRKMPNGSIYLGDLLGTVIGLVALILIICIIVFLFAVLSSLF